MLLCPRQLVRFRLRALLSTPCRNPGRWHRSLRTPTYKHTIQCASSHTSSVREFATENRDTTDYQLDLLRTNRDPPTSPILASTKRPARNGRKPRTGTREQHSHGKQIGSDKEAENFLAGDNHRHRTRLSQPPVRPPINPRRKVIRVPGSQEMANLAFHRTNHEIQRERSFLGRKSRQLAIALRCQSIYSSRRHGLGTWQRAYEAVYKAKHYKRNVDDMKSLPVLNKEGLLMLEKIQTDCYGVFREAWEATSRDTKAVHWQALALWLLQNDPKRLLDFLVVTMKNRHKPDFTMVTDCFLYLDNFYYADWLKDWKSGPRSYPWMVEYCLRPATWPIISPPQKGIRLFIRRSRPYAVRLALRTMKSRKIKWNAETQLCLMNRFIQLGQVERALDALKVIPRLNDSNFTMNSQGVLRHCCKLLTLDTVEDGQNGRNFRILPQLLELGVRPDRDMMNLVLSNAFKTGDYQLGTDMLGFMKNQNYTLDSYTYVTLLTDAVSRGDRGRLHELLDEVDAQDEIRKNPYVASKIFHSHYVFTVKHMDVDADPSDVFYSMLDLYKSLHDITPLKELLILPPHYSPQQDGPKIPPSPIALYIMIATYFRCKSRFSTVQRIYHQFRELVMQGHPSIAPLAATDHTYNEFLLAFRKSSRALRSCVRVVEDMLHPPTESPTGKVIAHTKPTMRSWAILLSAFIWHRQSSAAEKIKEMMAKHQVEYNDVTWNLIINGYANSQKVPETAAAIKAMEEQGFAIDSYTMKSLRYLRDPERLWVAVDELDKAAHKSEPTPAATPERETIVRSNEVIRDDLLDQGLSKLGEKVKPRS